MSEQANKQSERAGGVKTVTDLVCVRECISLSKDGLERSLHHLAECKSTLTRGA